MKSVERSPKQKVAKWARDVLGEEAYTSPRCPRYPECGGEDGSGRCRECAKYAKAVEALLDKLDAGSR